jgi:hypothetical protein
LALALTCLLTLAGPAAAQSGPSDEEGELKLPDWQDWITLEEEGAPEPPLLRVQAGLVAALEVNTRVRADRADLAGSRLDDLEEEQGLASSGLAPWIELSIGGAVRAGGDLVYLGRLGDYRQQEERVAFDGKLIAEPGDWVKPEMHYFTAGTFIEWDFLYGETYRFGLVGGARYFLFDVELRGVRRQSPQIVKASARAELLSPYFGGLVELTPFPYLSVQTQVQFMNWSWEQIRLKKARYLRFRLGFTVRPTDWLGFGAEYRFEVIRAEGRSSRDEGQQIDGALATNNVLLHLELTF